jgi:hypothetical protein
MASFDWKSIVGAVAPTIGTALGGPLGGMAAQAITGALGIKTDAKEGDIARAVASATPDQLLAIKKAEIEFAKRMRELDIDLERIAAGDRDSARQREVRTGDHWTPRILACVVTVGFFATLFYTLRNGVPQGAGGEVVLVLLGSLGTAWTGICAYYYGSSAGSRAKDNLIASK